MIRAEEVVGTIQAALEREPRINVHSHPIEITFDNGVVTLAGHVEGIAAKKLALEIAASPSPVSNIVDRLRVEPSEQMEDGAIRDHVCDALIEEPAFKSYSIRALVKQEMEAVRTIDDPKRIFDVEVTDGVVILNGMAESLSHKRLAGVLAWWVPGSCDVVNGIELSYPMDDNDEELADLIRLVLEKDPMVNAGQVRVRCNNSIVTLEGAVASDNSKGAAEADAWYVFGVNQVVNNLIITGRPA